jgi:hypothetical protein
MKSRFSFPDSRRAASPGLDALEGVEQIVGKRSKETFANLDFPLRQADRNNSIGPSRRAHGASPAARFQPGRQARNCDPPSEMIPGKLFTTLDLPYNPRSRKVTAECERIPRGAGNAKRRGLRVTTDCAALP